MPWLTIIVMLAIYFLKRKDGASDGEAAVWAAGAGALTYMAADPSNENNWFGVGQGDGTAGQAGSVLAGGTGSNTTVGGGLLSGIPDWAVGAGAGAVAGSALGGKNLWMWVAGGALALLLLK